jgi:hypothetical protein
MQYLVSVIDDTAGLATPDEDAAIDVFNDRLKAEGYWVFAGGLAVPSSATVIDNRGEEAIFTDGPSAKDLPARVSGVLAVLFLVFNEGYLPRRSSPSTGPSRSPSLMARRWQWRPSTGLSPGWPAITSTMRPAPTCCAGWAAVGSRARRTTKPSSWRATPPRSPTWHAAATSWGRGRAARKNSVELREFEPLTPRCERDP